jgi:hypothetical protein
MADMAAFGTGPVSGFRDGLVTGSEVDEGVWTGQVDWNCSELALGDGLALL